MKRSDRVILLALPLLAVAIGFWLLVLSPKQKEAADLQERIETAQSRLDAAETQVIAAEEARAAFAENYADVVKLGPAVPEGSDQSTLIYDMAEIGRANSVNFRSFVVSEAPSDAPAAPAATEPAAPAAEPSATAPVSEAPSVATEASAASLPIGAAVGPAGLPVMPYEFDFLGDFFDMADFFADVDGLVDTKGVGKEPRIDGRLLTIDGFSLTGDPLRGFPRVKASFAVTSYIVPPEQGISAGASPSGPAPAGAPDAPVPVTTGDASDTAPAAVVTP